VRQALARAEEVCRRHGLTPDELPAETRRAFHVLSALELDQLPLRPEARPEPRIRVPRLLVSRDRILARLRALAALQTDSGRGSLRESPSASALLHEISEAAAGVIVRCDRSGVSPAALADPSRRAYQWLSYLSEPAHLAAHVASVATAQAIDPRVTVDLYHIAGLYHGQWHGEAASLTISEGFVQAPPEVLRALVKVILPYTRKRQHRALIHGYAEGEAFRSQALAVERSGGASASAPRGRHHDLQASFERVNQGSFSGGMEPPRLAWTRKPSRWEFGHYEAASDTLTVSAMLDDASVPAFVVDFVVYHELLHRRLGVQVQNGRRRVHTALFRQEERRFWAFVEADAYLTSLAGREDEGESGGAP
jgi:hypothetical protein